MLIYLLHFRNLESADLNKTAAALFLFSPKVGKTTNLNAIYEVFPRIQPFAPQAVPPLMDKRVPKMEYILHTAKRPLVGMIPHLDILAYHYYEELIREGHSFAAEDVSTLVLSEDRVVALSQFNLLNTANSMGAALGITSNDAVLNALLPYDSVGLTAGLLMPITRRAKMVVSSDVPSQDIPRIHESIAQHGVNTMVGNSELWTAILTSAQPAQAAKFAAQIKAAVVVCGNKPVEESLVQGIKSTLGVPTVHVTHGTDTTSGVALINGRAIPNTQIKLIDSTGKDSTSSGFIAVKGVNVFKGFYKAENATTDASSIKSDWHVTNIKAKQDSSSSFTVTN